MSNRNFRLDEIAEIVDCEHKTAPVVDSSIYRSIRTTDIKNGIIDYINANCVEYETYLEWTKREIPEAHDIILAREAPVGEVGWIREGNLVCLGQRTVLIKVIRDDVSKRFLLYYLINPETKYELQVQSVGSVVSHLNMKNIRAFSISLPPLPEQKAIASVLSSLDDKIDLLHRQNKTLEAMAEALFRQWFIEEAGDDWEEVELGSAIETTSGGTPSRDVSEYYDIGIYNWVKSKELNRSYIFETEEKISDLGLKKSSAKLFPKNTVLIAMYGATVGEYAITANQMACNQAVCAVKPNANYPYTFLFMFFNKMNEEIINMAVGSAQQNISQALIKQLPVPSCYDRIKKFHRNTEKLFEKIKLNCMQIRTLEKLRDNLLPKLMSGEVRVNYE